MRHQKAFINCHRYSSQSPQQVFGKYCGYPKCCIKAFTTFRRSFGGNAFRQAMEQRRKRLILELHRRFLGSGFVPCKHHRRGRGVVALINRRRIKPRPYKLFPQYLLLHKPRRTIAERKGN